MFKTIKSYQLHRHFTGKQSTVQLKKNIWHQPRRLEKLNKLCPFLTVSCSV